MSYFHIGLNAEPNRLPDGRRARHLVADILRKMADNEERSMATRMKLAAGKIESGVRPSKKTINAIGMKRLQRAELIFESEK